MATSCSSTLLPGATYVIIVAGCRTPPHQQVMTVLLAMQFR
jgi:hypothetical protein